MWPPFLGVSIGTVELMALLTPHVNTLSWLPEGPYLFERPSYESQAAADLVRVGAVHRAVQAQLAGAGGGCQAAVDTELGQDVGNVHAGGVAADEQLFGDLAVAPAGHTQVQHLKLAG